MKPDTTRQVRCSEMPEAISANAIRQKMNAERLAVRSDIRRVKSAVDHEFLSRPNIETIPENPVIAIATSAKSGSKSE